MSNTLTRNSDLFTLVYDVGRKISKCSFLNSDTNYLRWNLFKSLVGITTHSCGNDAQLQHKSAVICCSNSYYGLKSSIDGKQKSCFPLASVPGPPSKLQISVTFLYEKHKAAIDAEESDEKNPNEWKDQTAEGKTFKWGVGQSERSPEGHLLCETSQNDQNRFLPKYSFTCSETEYSNKYRSYRGTEYIQPIRNLPKFSFYKQMVKMSIY